MNSTNINSKHSLNHHSLNERAIRSVNEPFIELDSMNNPFRTRRPQVANLKIRLERCGIAQLLAFIPPNPGAPGSIPGIPEILSKKIDFQGKNGQCRRG